MMLLAALMVFFISMATVIGPTPPGTGVMKLAFFRTPVETFIVSDTCSHAQRSISLSSDPVERSNNSRNHAIRTKAHFCPINSSLDSNTFRRIDALKTLYLCVTVFLEDECLDEMN